MKLTESHLRNLIKQELKQFLKLNEGYDTSSNLDSLDAEIPDEDEDEELSDEDEELNALDPDLEPYVSPYKPGSTRIVSPREIRDDANELGLYDETNPMHVAAQARSRRFRK
jgi:hypothetical protein